MNMQTMANLPDKEYEAVLRADFERQMLKLFPKMDFSTVDTVAHGFSVGDAIVYKTPEARMAWYAYMCGRTAVNNLMAE